MLAYLMETSGRKRAISKEDSQAWLDYWLPHGAMRMLLAEDPNRLVAGPIVGLRSGTA
jgi:hypothetical protein